MRNSILTIVCILALGSFVASPIAEAAKKKENSTPPTKKEEKVTVTKSGLKIEEVAVGSGAEATAGKNVRVHYTGWLTNGTKFDSSVDRGTPFEFPLGKGRVIAGWDEGVAGMKEGGKRKLTIPAKLGYGDAGAGGVIPGGATLVFDVELIKVL